VYVWCAYLPPHNFIHAWHTVGTPEILLSEYRPLTPPRSVLFPKPSFAGGDILLFKCHLPPWNYPTLNEIEFLVQLYKSHILTKIQNIGKNLLLLSLYCFSHLWCVSICCLFIQITSFRWLCLVHAQAMVYPTPQYIIITTCCLYNHCHRLSLQTDLWGGHCYPPLKVKKLELVSRGGSLVR